MPWGQFFTYVGQGLIVVVIIGVIAAGVVAIVQSERGKK